MAVRAATFSYVKGPSGGIDALVMQWVGLLNGDMGQAVQRPDLADKTVQFEGTFGAGGNATIEGSNDSVTGAVLDGNWHALSNPEGGQIGSSTGAITQVMESTRWIRPHITTGDATTNITVTVVARRTMRGG